MRGVVCALILVTFTLPSVDAGFARIVKDDALVDEVQRRGTDLENWMPALDGHVFVSASGDIVVKVQPTFGGEPIVFPVHSRSGSDDCLYSKGKGVEVDGSDCTSKMQ